MCRCRGFSKGRLAMRSLVLAGLSGAFLAGAGAQPLAPEPLAEAAVPHQGSVEWTSELARGHYGGPTPVRSLENTLRLGWSRGRWFASGSVSHLLEREGENPELHHGERGRDDDRVDSGLASSTFSAWEDLTVTLGRRIDLGASDWRASLSGSLRLPTGHRELRVVRPEPQLDVGLAWRPTEAWGARLKLGHRWMQSRTEPVRSLWIARLSTDWQVFRGFGLDASCEMRRPRRSQGELVREATAGVTVGLGHDVQWSLYLLAGRGDSSPERGVGSSLSWDW